MRTGMAGIYPGKNGAPHCAGFDMDVVFGQLLLAARMPDPAASAITYAPLNEWLMDGYEPTEIAELLRRRASQPGYKPPRSLSYFNTPVRQELQRHKVWIDAEGKPVAA